MTIQVHSPIGLACLLATILFAVVLVVWGTRSFFAERRRLDARAKTLRAWANDNDADFIDALPKRRFPIDATKGVRLFTYGQGHRVTNHTRRQLEHAGGTLTLHTADIRFTQGLSDARTHHHLSFVLLETPLRNMPATRVRAEHRGDRNTAALGVDDIDFEDAEFSRENHVSSDDKRFAYDLLDPRMIELLKQHPDLPGPPALEFVGAHILLYPNHAMPGEQRWIPENQLHAFDDGFTAAKLWTPDALDAAARHALAIYDRLPRHLARDLTHDNTA